MLMNFYDLELIFHSLNVSDQISWATMQAKKTYTSSITAKVCFHGQTTIISAFLFQFSHNLQFSPIVDAADARITLHKPSRRLANHAKSKNTRNLSTTSSARNAKSRTSRTSQSCASKRKKESPSIVPSCKESEIGKQMKNTSVLRYDRKSRQSISNKQQHQVEQHQDDAKKASSSVTAPSQRKLQYSNDPRPVSKQSQRQQSSATIEENNLYQPLNDDPAVKSSKPTSSPDKGGFQSEFPATAIPECIKLCSENSKRYFDTIRAVVQTRASQRGFDKKNGQSNGQSCSLKAQKKQDQVNSQLSYEDINEVIMYFLYIHCCSYAPNVF